MASTVERQRPNREREAERVEDSRQGEPSQGPAAADNMVFPFAFNSAHVKIHFKPREEQKKMLISVEPENSPIPLVAGVSGTVSIKESGSDYVVSLSPDVGKQVLFFELNKEHTKLFVEDGASVEQEASIAESSKPVLFYVKKEDQLTRLCFSIDQLSENVEVVQNYENHPDCKQ